MAQCVAYEFYLHQKVSIKVLGFFPPYVYSAIPWSIDAFDSALLNHAFVLFANPLVFPNSCRCIASRIRSVECFVHPTPIMAIVVIMIVVSSWTSAWLLQAPHYGSELPDFETFIIQFTTSSGVSEQMSRAKHAREASSAEQMNKWVVRVNGQVSGPLLTSWFMAVLNHSVHRWHACTIVAPFGSDMAETKVKNAVRCR